MMKMQIITQINGTNASNNAVVARLFAQHRVTVTHNHLEEFMIAPLQDAWERHEMMVDLLQAVRNSTFHTVVDTHGLITSDMATQILQAMLAGRPIILSELPDFADNVDTYTQRIIASRLHSFYITNLTKLQDDQVRSTLRHIRDTSVDYALGASDDILIRSKIRNYLRGILYEPNARPLPSELPA
jgi:hypothetical protein